MNELQMNWYPFIIIGLLFLIIVLTIVIKYIVGFVLNTADPRNEEDDDFKYMLVYLPLVTFTLAATYLFTKNLGIAGHTLEWFNLLIRWTHVIIGIAWIGASFYFVFLENSLNRTKGLRPELVGNLWAVHGGGFYYLEKYKVAPKQLPDKLHWFKYEAYFTWISGFILLCIVFYFNAKGMLINPEANISEGMAISIGLSVLLLGWLCYDLLCKTKLVHYGWLFTAIGFGSILLLSWALSHVFNGRGTYIHIGALLGTLMAGNVFRAIIPAQKALVSAVKAGRLPDPELGKTAGLRSLHNNYMTLPVVFIMISNHFPSTFGHEYNWAILGGLFVASGLLRHHLNLKEKGREASWILPISTFLIFTLAYVTAPTIQSGDNSALPEVHFSQVNQIIKTRCTTCHSAKPTDDLWKTAPNGVKMDLPEEIIALKDKIFTRAVMTKNMPLANKTNMTDEERLMIKSWILSGGLLEN